MSPIAQLTRNSRKSPMIDVCLSVKSPDAPPESAVQFDMILPLWAEHDGESAVVKAIEVYFDTETWDEWFGLDESDTRGQKVS